VINGNHREAPHLVDQHGIPVFVNSELEGVSRANGGPGNPKMINFVEMASEAASWPANYLAATLAHELFHCVNVWHHGDVDENRYWHGEVAGQLQEVRSAAAQQGAAITVREESGRDVTPRYLEPLSAPGVQRWKVWVGRPGGQHSGHENCVMRYDCAMAYVSQSAADVRYVVTEPVGQSLCGSPNGTGVNDPGRSPQSRYGAAGAGRGNCLSQILVNDAANAQQR
jgi:hypothetical protein